MTDYIVCGWYTPDYAKWAHPLRDNLDRLGIDHDFVEVEKLDGGWEHNTMRKPGQILAAMYRHPNRTIVFLDVDCAVLEPLDALAGINDDVAVHFRCKMLKDGTPRLNTRSGTLVINPTRKAAEFVAVWHNLSVNAPRGCVDQRTLPMAIATTPGLSMHVLDVRYCAVPSDGASKPVILHDSASRATAKVPSFMRRLYHLAKRGQIGENGRAPSSDGAISEA